MNIVVSRELFENLVDDAISLRAEWAWKQTAPRPLSNYYAKEYAELEARIAEAVNIRDAVSKIQIGRTFFHTTFEDVSNE